MQDLSIVAILNFVGKLLGAISILLLVRKPEDYFWQALTVSLSSVVVAIISFTISIKMCRPAASLKRMMLSA